MATTITKGAETVTAQLVIGWDTNREARTLVHAVIGKSTPDFTLRASAPRTGTLTYHFTLLADALACEVLHADDPAPVTVTEPAIPAGSMTYVVTGGVSVSAATQDAAAWQVTVDFTEVAS